jgi:hypothetical protein
VRQHCPCFRQMPTAKLLRYTIKWEHCFGSPHLIRTRLTGTIERSLKRFQLSTGDTSGKEKRDPTERDCRALGSTAAMT